jgi:pimeloyl-ACP methyl ester carboxylesterase
MNTVNNDLIIHFSHANGFHPQSYRKILDLLRPDYSVLTGLHRPLWDSKTQMEDVSSWQVFADDMIEFLESKALGKVCGVGHSMGAVATLLAAIKRPDLFNAVVLIEPVFMPLRIMLPFTIMPLFLRRKIPFIQKAITRPDCWKSRDEAFVFHRKKRVFENVDDDVLWDYINSGTKETEDNSFTLNYSKAWEAHCYLNLSNTWPLINKCSVPVLGIKGESSDVLLPSSWQRWKKLTPSQQFVEVPGAGHLLPFEKPNEVAELIKSAICG